MGEWQPTVAEAVGAYLRDAEIEGRPVGSIRTYRSALSAVRDSGEPVAALALSLRDLLHAKLRTVQPNTGITVIAAHRSLVRYCQARGWLVSDPLAGLKSPRKRDVPHRYLTPDQVRRLWAACDAPLDRAAFRLLAMGLRAGEACAVRRQDISETPDGAVLLVRTEKGGDPRLLPLDAPAMAAIRALDGDTTVLGIGPHCLWVRMRAVGLRAGIPFHPHMLRHTWAMAAFEALDQGTLQTLGGWRSANMPRYYARSALRRVALARARQVGLSGRVFGE